MKHTAQLKKIGNSLFVLINERIKKNLNLNEGDIVSFEILPSEEQISIHCDKCGTIFDSNREDVYDCIVCDNEILPFEGEVVE